MYYDNKTKRIRSDLILNNFGEWLKGLFTFTNAVLVSVSMTDIVGTPIGVGIYPPTASVIPYNNQFGLRIRIGSGSIIARSDFKMTTDFVNPPESLQSTILAKSTYTSGTGKITGISTGFSPTGGAGTIREAGLSTILGRTAVGNQSTVLITHDAISPPVGFLAGQQIVVTYTWQL